MAEAAVADDVDKDVFVEGAQVVHGNFTGKRQCFGIITVDVQHGRLDEFGGIRAVHGRAGVERIRSGEADLVVDDDVQGTADAVAAHL